MTTKTMLLYVPDNMVGMVEEVASGLGVDLTWSAGSSEGAGWEVPADKVEPLRDAVLAEFAKRVAIIPTEEVPDEAPAGGWLAVPEWGLPLVNAYRRIGSFDRSFTDLEIWKACDGLAMKPSMIATVVEISERITANREASRG